MFGMRIGRKFWQRITGIANQENPLFCTEGIWLFGELEDERGKQILDSAGQYQYDLFLNISNNILSSLHTRLSCVQL
jgi:hypothetical protein